MKENAKIHTLAKELRAVMNYALPERTWLLIFGSPQANFLFFIFHSVIAFAD